MVALKNACRPLATLFFLLILLSVSLAYSMLDLQITTIKDNEGQILAANKAINVTAIPPESQDDVQLTVEAVVRANCNISLYRCLSECKACSKACNNLLDNGYSFLDVTLSLSRNAGDTTYTVPNKHSRLSFGECRPSELRDGCIVEFEITSKDLRRLATGHEGPIGATECPADGSVYIYPGALQMSSWAYLYKTQGNQDVVITRGCNWTKCTATNPAYWWCDRYYPSYCGWSYCQRRVYSNVWGQAAYTGLGKTLKASECCGNTVCNEIEGENKDSCPLPDGDCPVCAPGDVTADGTINCADLNCLKSYVLGKTLPAGCTSDNVNTCGDAAANGSIDTWDVRELINSLSSATVLPDCLPVPSPVRPTDFNVFVEKSVFGEDVNVFLEAEKGIVNILVPGLDVNFTVYRGMDAQTAVPETPMQYNDTTKRYETVLTTGSNGDLTLGGQYTVKATMPVISLWQGDANRQMFTDINTFFIQAPCDSAPGFVCSSNFYADSNNQEYLHASCDEAGNYLPDDSSLSACTVPQTICDPDCNSDSPCGLEEEVCVPDPSITQYTEGFLCDSWDQDETDYKFRYKDGTFSQIYSCGKVPYTGEQKICNPVCTKNLCFGEGMPVCIPECNLGLEYRPVCGLDITANPPMYRTYWNDCAREKSAAAFDHNGPCNYGTEELFSYTYEPVCGADGKWYTNLERLQYVGQAPHPSGTSGCSQVCIAETGAETINCGMDGVTYPSATFMSDACADITMLIPGASCLDWIDCEDNTCVSLKPNNIVGGLGDEFDLCPQCKKPDFSMDDEIRDGEKLVGGDFNIVLEDLEFGTYDSNEIVALFYYCGDADIGDIGSCTIDGNLVCEDTYLDSEYSCDYNLSAGTYDLAARLVDSTKDEDDSRYVIAEWNEYDRRWIDRLEIIELVLLENCKNGVDDDGDLLIDCSDVQDCGTGLACDDYGGVCSPLGECESPLPEVEDCRNEEDDDGDGLIDCEDSSDCTQGMSCGYSGEKCTLEQGCEVPPKEVCDNGIDDDGDGSSDCVDQLDCGTGSACKTGDGKTGTCYNRACVECRGDNDCTAPQVCTTVGTCGSCQSRSDCDSSDADCVSGACNEPPEVSSVSISPDPATTKDDLECLYSYSDPEGDSEGETEFLWYEDGEELEDFKEVILPGSELIAEVEYSCTVIPIAAAGNSTGDPVSSDNTVLPEKAGLAAMPFWAWIIVGLVVLGGAVAGVFIVLKKKGKLGKKKPAKPGEPVRKEEKEEKKKEKKEEGKEEKGAPRWLMRRKEAGEKKPEQGKKPGEEKPGPEKPVQPWPGKPA